MRNYNYNYVTMVIDIDIDEILQELSHSQREDLYNDLKAEFGNDTMYKGDSSDDQDFADSLNQLWKSRTLLTPKQKEKIRLITLEKYI